MGFIRTFLNWKVCFDVILRRREERNLILILNRCTRGRRTTTELLPSYHQEHSDL